MKKKFMVLSIVLSLLLIIAACGKESANGGDKITKRSIGTGGSGGVFYVVGAGMGNIVTSNSEVVDLTAQSTAATAENLNLTQTGDLDFSFSVYDAAIDAYNGEGGYDRKYDNLRLVMAGHGGYQHVIVRDDSNIETLADLKGKKIGIPPGDIGVKIMEATIKPYGLTLEDVETIPLSFNEMANGLKDKTLDVATVFAGIPASSIIELGTSIDIRFVDQTDEGVKQLVKDYPYWFEATIPGETYGQDKDIKTFLAPYVVVANKDVPDKEVYEFIKIIIEKNDDLKAVHPEGAHYNGTNEFYTRDTLLPFHPGAEKYLKEIGAIK